MEKYLRKMNMRGITHHSVPLLIYSSTHPPIYSFIHSSTHSFIHPSPTHSFIHPPSTHSLIHPPLTHSFICPPLSHAFIHSSIYTSIHSSVHPSTYPPTIHQVPTVLWATPGTSIKDHTKPRSRGGTERIFLHHPSLPDLTAIPKTLSVHHLPFLPSTAGDHPDTFFQLSA